MNRAETEALPADRLADVEAPPAGVQVQPVPTFKQLVAIFTALAHAEHDDAGAM
jgi:hypothetical protein